MARRTEPVQLLEVTYPPFTYPAVSDSSSSFFCSYFLSDIALFGRAFLLGTLFYFCGFSRLLRITLFSFLVALHDATLS